jgi:uncharacterized protein involved in high-affinity Fe2+ transport
VRTKFDINGFIVNNGYKLWPRLESSIYRTRGEHANHYTTDAFWVKYIYILYSVSFSGKGSMGTGMFVIMTQEEDDIKKIL